MHHLGSCSTVPTMPAKKTKRRDFLLRTFLLLVIVVLVITLVQPRINSSKMTSLAASSTVIRKGVPHLQSNEDKKKPQLQQGNFKPKQDFWTPEKKCRFVIASPDAAVDEKGTKCHPDMLKPSTSCCPTIRYYHAAGVKKDSFQQEEETWKKPVHSKSPSEEGNKNADTSTSFLVVVKNITLQREDLEDFPVSKTEEKAKRGTLRIVNQEELAMIQCHGCNTFKCCDEYSRCLTCCLTPWNNNVRFIGFRNRQEKEDHAVLEKGSSSQLYLKHKYDSFDYCVERCRTSSVNVGVEGNQYKSDFHHCFSSE